MEYLSHRGYDPAFGARPVKRVVQRELESELARASRLLICYGLPHAVSARVEPCKFKKQPRLSLHGKHSASFGIACFAVISLRQVHGDLFRGPRGQGRPFAAVSWWPNSFLDSSASFTSYVRLNLLGFRRLQW